MFCTLFSSDSVYSRFDVLTGTLSPLHLGKWVDVVVTDLHEGICSMFGYTYRDYTSEESSVARNLRVESELQRSISHLDITTPRTPHVAGSFTGRRRRAESLSTEVLTPLRQRVEKQMVFSGLNKKSATAMGKNYLN
jgi:hypothetical protein